MCIKLLDRINRVINTDAFQRQLDKEGIILMDFQLEWHDAKSFEELIPAYQNAILAGEQELNQETYDLGV